MLKQRQTIKPLIEEVYTLNHDEHHLDEIRKGRYDIQTEAGAIILPTVWSSIVKPFVTIKISFWESKVLSRQTSPTPEGRRKRSRSSGRQERPDEYLEEISIDVGDPNPPSPNRSYYEEGVTQSEGDGSEEDYESTDSIQSEDERYEDNKQPEPPREVLSPTDAEGNKLSFSVDTSWVGGHSHVSKPLGSKRDDSETPRVVKDAFEGSVETLRITKAMSEEAENRAMIQLSTLPGPKTHQLHDGVTMTWYHLQADRLDFSRFKQACLDTPNISDRLQSLIREVLANIERHKVKAFLDGLYIEPGTVLRADERCQPDPQAVIFSCIPYFDLQPLAKKLSMGLKEQNFPPRTLMQSLYPYEPVRERDSEQAYRKFGNDRSTHLVYVPNIWIMNIGADIIVTYGHRPLTAELTKSINVVQEDLSQLGVTDITKDALTNIRLTDWDSRVHLYSLEACRSYFQMEQKLKDLRFLSRGRMNSKSLLMSDGDRLVKPNDWGTIVRRTDRNFTDLTSLSDHKVKELKQNSAVDSVASVILPSTLGSVSPFFHWPAALEEETKRGGTNPKDIDSADVRLEFAERGMANATLDRYSTTNAVDESFTSTAFYQALPEDTHEHIKAQFASLETNTGQMSNQSYHATIVVGQCASIVEKSDGFCKIVQATLGLFVKDVDKNVMLRKVWGAMGNVHKLVAGLQNRGTVILNPADTDPNTKPFRHRDKSW